MDNFTYSRALETFRNRSIVPPDGWRYFHTETGHITRASDYDGWIMAARVHRQVNNLPIPADFAAQMENQLCAIMPPEWCEYADPNRTYVDTRFSWGDFMDGMTVFADWMLKGFQMVDQSEADRRAKICTGCYLNVNVPGCGACHAVARVVTGVVGQRSTPYDDKLQACAVCKCANRASVHFPMSALEETDTPEKQSLYPKTFCWRNKESPNYKTS